jgi:hypothetical protein
LNKSLKKNVVSENDWQRNDEKRRTDRWMKRREGEEDEAAAV